MARTQRGVDGSSNEDESETVETDCIRFTFTWRVRKGESTVVPMRMNANLVDQLDRSSCVHGLRHYVSIRSKLYGM